MNSPMAWWAAMLPFLVTGGVLVRTGMDIKAQGGNEAWMAYAFSGAVLPGVAASLLQIMTRQLDVRSKARPNQISQATRNQPPPPT